MNGRKIAVETDLEKKILDTLIEHPEEKLEVLAKQLDIDVQELSLKITYLEQEGILRGKIASFIPERIGLQRKLVVFSISSIKQYSLLRDALSEHNYIRSYNYIYGKNLGILAFFDLPNNTEKLFRKFLDYCKNRMFCDEYKVHNSIGLRVSKPRPLQYPHLDSVSQFDIISFWKKRLVKPRSHTQSSSAIDLNKVEPLHFFLLRDLTSWHPLNRNRINLQTDLKEISKHYYEFFLHLDKKNKLSKEEKFYHENLKEFYKKLVRDQQKENFKTDEENKKQLNKFKEKYYTFVREHLIENPRWIMSKSVNNVTSDMIITRGFILENSNQKIHTQLFKLFKEESFPFSIAIEVLEEATLLRTTLPAYYDSKLFYQIHDTFENYEVFLLDYFGKHGMYWLFDTGSFDWQSKEWKTDESWMYDSIIKRIEYKIPIEDEIHFDVMDWGENASREDEIHFDVMDWWKIASREEKIKIGEAVYPAHPSASYLYLLFRLENEAKETIWTINKIVRDGKRTEEWREKKFEELIEKLKEIKEKERLQDVCEIDDLIDRLSWQVGIK